MHRIRILLAGLPRMLADIVERFLAEEPDLQVIGPVRDRDDLAQAIGQAGAEVVIVGLERNEVLHTYDALLYAHPRVKLFALVGDGRHALLYELHPHTVPLGDVSPGGLIQAIRAAAHASTG